MLLIHGITFQSTLPTRGSDLICALNRFSASNFNPRSPRGGATYNSLQRRSAFRHFNPRSPRGGATARRCVAIQPLQFQSTLPTRGSDFSFTSKRACSSVFQSTLPTRGSDSCALKAAVSICYFNPRSPRGGATSNPDKWTRTSTISIHAPHEGERQRKSAFVCSISANLLNIIHCGTVTRAVSRRRIALFRLFSVRRSGVFMYAYASH